MYLVKLALRNWLRNTRRSIISGISICLAITMIIFARSYIAGIFKNITGNVIKLVSGHVTVMTPEFQRRERLLPLSEAVMLDEYFSKLAAQPGIAAVSPRIKFGVLLGKDELDVPALGYAFDPEIERSVSALDRRLVDGAYLARAERSMIIGRGLAARLGVKVGDSLTIITRTAYDSPAGVTLLVRGIFETGLGGVDRSLFYIPLDVGQRLLDLEKRATEVAVMVDRPASAIAISRRIHAATGLAAIPFQYNQLLRLINVANVIYGFFYFIIILVAGSTVANTMLMVIFERTREIGMLKALGFKTREVIVLFLCEAGYIGLLGSVAGAAIGAVLSYWLKYRGIDLSMASETASQSMPFGPVIYLEPTPLIVFGSLFFGVMAALVIAFLPVSRVTRLEPARALRAA